MGFCTTVNPRTGRQVFVCDFCSAYPAKRVRCPYNYCQKWAICADCRKAGKAKLSSAGAGTHKEWCLPRHIEHVKKQEEDASVVASGAFVRRAALIQDQDKDGRAEIVRVLFRNKDGMEKYAHMERSTYHAYYQLVPATIEDYEKHGRVEIVNVADLYAPLATR